MSRGGQRIGYDLSAQQQGTSKPDSKKAETKGFRTASYSMANAQCVEVALIERVAQ